MNEWTGNVNGLGDTGFGLHFLATNYAMSSLFNFYHCTRCSGLFSLFLFLSLSILHLLLSVCSLSAWVRACYTSYILFLTHTASKSYWIYHLASGYTQTHSMEFLPFTSLLSSLSLSLSVYVCVCACEEGEGCNTNQAKDRMEKSLLFSGSRKIVPIKANLHVKLSQLYQNPTSKRADGKHE